MDTKLIVTAIGFVLAAVVMYGQYAKIAKTPGMTTLSRATLAFRLVISVFSIGLSIYGVFNFVFDFLIQNGASRGVALSISTGLAITIAAALEYLLVNSEKAVYESWFYGLKKFAAIVLVVLFAQSLNYATMRANATALFNKIFAKEAKVVDSVVLDTSKYALDVNKKSIERLQRELESVKVDAEALYKNSKGYAKYSSLAKKYETKASSSKLVALANKGNEWAKSEIAKYEAKAKQYREKLVALKQRAVQRAKELEREKRLKLQERIDALVAKSVTLSNSTLATRDKKLKEIETKAESNSEVFANMALYIVIASVFLSLIHAMTSDSTLVQAKEAAIIQLARDVEMQEKINSLEYQMALAKQNYGMEPTDRQKRSDTDRPSLDRFEEEKSTVSDVVSSLGLSLEPKAKEEVDFNEELWKIAKGAAIDGVHPTRAAMKDLAKGYGLDVANWTEKYRDYLADMGAKGRVRQDGKRYLIVGEWEDEAAYKEA